MFAYHTYASLLLQLLGGVKGHMLELLKSVFTAQSPDDSVLPDVMATIFATVLAELSFFSSHVSIASESVYVPHMYIISRRCVTCKNGCSPLLAFGVISLE